MVTGVAAVKAGVVMFIIPYIFAFYPELLLIQEAQLDPNSKTGAFLPGYDGEVHWLVMCAYRTGAVFYREFVGGL